MAIRRMLKWCKSRLSRWTIRAYDYDRSEAASILAARKQDQRDLRNGELSELVQNDVTAGRFISPHIPRLALTHQHL
jgi:hypothetical protein